MKASNTFKTKTNVYVNNSTSSLDTLKDASGNSLNTIVSTAVSSGISGLAANVAADDITMAAMQTQISGTATDVSNLTNNYISVSQRTATLEGRASAADTKFTSIDSSLNALITGKANIASSNTFTGGNAFTGIGNSLSITTGTINIGSSSGTNTTIYNPKIRGTPIAYDNPIKYFDASYNITDNREIPHKAYVDSAIANAVSTATGGQLTLNNTGSWNNRQSYATAMTFDASYQIPNKQYVDDTIATSLSSAKSDIYNFYSKNAVGGCLCATIDASGTLYYITSPNFGTNTFAGTSSYTIAMYDIYFPNGTQSSALLTRSVVMRFTMNIDYASAIGGTNGLRGQTMSFSTQKNIANLKNLTPNYYCSSDFILTITGTSAANGVDKQLNVYQPVGTKLYNNSDATTSPNTWNLQNSYYNTTSIVVKWYPIQFTLMALDRVRCFIAVPNRLNYVDVNYWINKVAWRIELLESVPIINNVSPAIPNGTPYPLNPTMSGGPYGGAYLTAV